MRVTPTRGTADDPAGRAAAQGTGAEPCPECGGRGWTIKADGGAGTAGRALEAGEDWRPADYRFHGALQDACGNPLFGQLIQQIQQGFHEVYDAPFGQPHLGQASIPLHMPLAEAVIAGNAKKGAKIMEDILDMVEAEIRQVMETQSA